MQVSINKKLADILDNERACQATHGTKMTKIIFRRLNELSAAPTLETMRHIGRFHGLKGDLEGCFSLDLVHPQRLILKPDHEEKNYLDGKTIILNKVTSVEIISIEDYH